MTLTIDEHTLTERAAAHALPEDHVPQPARLKHGVTDLDAARLILRLEAGEIVVPAATDGCWQVLSERSFPHLSRTVRECLRVGLVQLTTVPTGPHTRRTQLAPAPIHLAGADTLPLCGPGKALRYRLTTKIRQADCLVCRTLAATHIDE